MIFRRIPAVFIAMQLGLGLGLLCTTVAAQHVTSASISGTIRYTGRVPKAEIANPGGFRDPLLEVDPAARGLRYALVYLERVDGQGEVALDKAEVDALPVAKMDQIDFRFTPQVLVVRPGQQVAFGNSDYENHNVRSLSGNPRNL